jgi:ribose 5-phosphate isomerase B
MKVFIASDHAGFDRKQQLASKLEQGYQVFDLGPYELNPEDDYPVYAKKVALAVKENPSSMGILVCKSGEGMAIAANKFNGIRAAIASSKEQAIETRQDNDSNVLSLSAGDLSDKEALEISKAWLDTPFSELDRHERRLHEIAEIESDNL